MKISVFTPECFFKKGSCSSEQAEGLYFGFFWRHFLMNIFRSAETEEGNRICYSTIFDRVQEQWASSKGVFPVASSKARTPTAQTSTFSSWCSPLSISGERQSRVPQKVLLRDFETTAQPKSAILSVLAETKMFQGLMSLWMMWREWRQDSPSHSCCRTTETWLSEKGPTLRMISQSCPLGAYSRMRVTEWESQKQPQSLRMLGWLMEDWTRIYLLICQQKLLSSSSALCIFLRATIRSELLSRATDTSPNFPLPTFLISRKSQLLHSHGLFIALQRL